MDKRAMRGGDWKTVGSLDEGQVEAVTLTPEAALDQLEDHPEEPEPVQAVVEKPDGSVEVLIEHPLRPHTGKGPDIMLGITKIVLRPMYVADIIDMDKADGDIGRIARMAARVSGLPETVMDRLHYLDYAKLHGIVGERLGNFLVASAAASARLPRR